MNIEDVRASLQELELKETKVEPDSEGGRRLRSEIKRLKLLLSDMRKYVKSTRGSIGDRL